MRELQSAPGGCLSRRAVLTVPAGLALTSALVTSAVADDATRLCTRWLTNEAETHRLWRRRDDVEDNLFHHHQWSLLTEAERQALPQARALHAIDARLARIHAEREALATKLPLTTATTRQGVMLKFRVVSDELEIQDFLDIHGLLKSAVRDLSAIW
jgi:hypothetical protein